jgi:hypothetical protein
MTRERRLTAWHESGHAVCTWLVGDVPGLTSVRPSQRWCGVAFATRQHHDRDLLDDLDLSLPAPLWHPAVRRRFELEALVALAGPVGESLARREEPPVHAGYVPPTPIERMLDQVTALTARESEQLANGDADAPEVDSDTRVAYDLAYLLAGQFGVRLQFELFRAHAIELLQHPRALRLVRILADELMRHETLGGEDVRRVLERAGEREPDRLTA